MRILEVLFGVLAGVGLFWVGTHHPPDDSHDVVGENKALRAALKSHCECYRHRVKQGDEDCKSCRQLEEIERKYNES